MDKPGREDQLISVMLDETFDSMNVEGVSKDRIELLKHFVNASSKGISKQTCTDEFLYNFLNRQNLFFLTGNFVHETNCLRFSFGHEVYDIPKNMESFSLFGDEVEKGINSLILLDSDTDTDQLRSIFSSFCGYDSDLIFVNTQLGVYLILPPEKDLAVYKWLANYLGIADEKSSLKAA